MSNRLDAMTVREKDGKKFWTKLGVAFPAKSGNGWTVMLDAMPAPVDGQFKLYLFEPKDDRQPRSAAGSAPTGDDDIPF